MFRFAQHDKEPHIAAVILSEAKNLRPSLPAPTDGHKTSVVVPNHHLNRATVGSFVRQARLSCCGASASVSSRIRSRRSGCERAQPKRGGSNDSVSLSLLLLPACAGTND